MFGSYPLGHNYQSNMSLVAADDKLQWGGESGDMVEALTLLNEFYNQGYIAQGFATHDYSKAIADITTGKAGMFFAPMFGAMTLATDFQTNIYTGILPEGAEIVATPLPGKDGYAKAYIPSSIASVMVASKKTENPEALFKLYSLGLEMVAFQEDPELFQIYNGDAINYSGWKLAVTNPLMPMKNHSNYKQVSAAVVSGDTSNLNAEQLSDYNNIVNNYLNVETVNEDNLPLYSAAYGLWHVFASPVGGYAAVDKVITDGLYTQTGYAAAATESMASKSSTLTDLVKVNIIKIAYGEEAPEYWNTVVENWHNLGGEDVLTDANTWFESK